jgi:hypothetical protein
MGQKVNPTGIRLGISSDWTSKWYASSKNFPDLLETDLRVRQFLKKKLAQCVGEPDSDRASSPAGAHHDPYRPTRRSHW